MKEMTINQRINFKMANLIAHMVITGQPKLKNIVSRSLQGKSRYNTCYDLERPPMPIEQVNEYINGKGVKVREYLRANMSNYEYLRVDLVGTPLGLRTTHSLVKELPSNYEDMERTGAVRFVDTAQVRLN